MLRRGSRGSQVRELQQWLNDQGHDAGPVDGIFGPKTEAAVRSFQRSAGIQVDGIVGPQTRGAMGSGGGGSTTMEGLPGGAELWKVGNRYFAVYDVPGTDVPLMYRFERADLLEAATGSKSPRADRTMTSAQARSRGAIEMGVTSELDTQLGRHPWDSFLAKVERDADIAPWLEDPEVLAHVAASWLRGVSPNLERTEWWQSRTDAERQWLERAASNPTQARRDLDDNRIRVRQQLIERGLANPSSGLVKALADRFTKGEASETELESWIARSADPFAPGTLPDDIQRLVDRHQPTRIFEDRVRDEWARWLGPAVSANVSDRQVAEWAGRLRNDPNAQVQLREHLQGQRLSLFPEHENPELTYDDIAAPWRGFVEQHWGQQADEMDPFFNKLIRNNDAAANLSLLRREGMDRGVGQVMQDLSRDTLRAFGGQVREAV